MKQPGLLPLVALAIVFGVLASGATDLFGHGAAGDLVRAGAGAGIAAIGFVLRRGRRLFRPLGGLVLLIGLAVAVAGVLQLFTS